MENKSNKYINWIQVIYPLLTTNVCKKYCIIASNLNRFTASWNLNNVNKLQPLMEFQCMFVPGPQWTLGASIVNYGVRFWPRFIILCGEWLCRGGGREAGWNIRGLWLWGEVNGLKERRWSPCGHRRVDWSIWSGVAAQSGHVKSVRSNRRRFPGWSA